MNCVAVMMWSMRTMDGSFLKIVFNADYFKLSDKSCLGAPTQLPTSTETLVCFQIDTLNACATQSCAARALREIVGIDIGLL